MLPTLLIVDDEPDIRLLARTLLAAEYDIVEATGGREALEILTARGDVEVVLLDIRMPDMDGFEVLAQLAERELLEQLSVIAFTAYSDAKMVDEVFRLGAHGMLRKPFTFEELTGVLAAARRGAR